MSAFDQKEIEVLRKFYTEREIAHIVRVCERYSDYPFVKELAMPRERVMFPKTMDPRYITVFGDCFRYAPPGRRPAWFDWPRVAKSMA